MKLATYGWDEKEQRCKIGGKGPVVMMETATPGHYESIGVLASYEVAGHVVKAVNSFEAMRAALEGLVAVEDSVTTKQERELRAEWLPKARGALQYAGPLTDVSRAAIEAAEAFADNPCEETRDAAREAGAAARDARAASGPAAWAVGAAARAAGAARDAAWDAGAAANREQADEIRRIWPTVGRGVETSSDPTKYATHVTITTEEE